MSDVSDDAGSGDEAEDLDSHPERPGEYMFQFVGSSASEDEDSVSVEASVTL